MPANAQQIIRGLWDILKIILWVLPTQKQNWMLNKNTRLERIPGSSLVSPLGHHPGNNCSTWTSWKELLCSDIILERTAYLRHHPGNKDKHNEHMFIKGSSLKDSTNTGSGITSRSGSRGAGDPPSQRAFSKMSIYGGKGPNFPLKNLLCHPTFPHPFPKV